MRKEISSLITGLLNFLLIGIALYYHIVEKNNSESIYLLVLVLVLYVARKSD